MPISAPPKIATNAMKPIAKWFIRDCALRHLGMPAVVWKVRAAYVLHVGHGKQPIELRGQRNASFIYCSGGV
jgi:hypothetical protein